MCIKQPNTRQSFEKYQISRYCWSHTDIIEISNCITGHTIDSLLSNCITRQTSENIRTFQTLSLRNQIFEPLSLTYTVHAIETVILSAYTNFRSSQSFLKHTCLTVLYSWNNSRIVYTFHTYVMTYKQSHFCNTHLTNLTQIWTETQHAWGQFIHCC